MLSIFGHVSRWLNKRVCFLVLMVFVFATAIILLVILGLSVGLFSSYVPALNTPEPEYLRSTSSDGGFESIKNTITPNEKDGVYLANTNLHKVRILN